MPKHLMLTLEKPLQQLLSLQAKGKIRRTLKRLSSPRRAIPTILVGVLMGLYALKVYIAIAYYDMPETIPIEGLAPIGMLYILLLKLLGVCIDRKKSGAGFRHEEVHHLVGGPFRLEQVRLFRVVGHAVSIFFTSLFAAAFFGFHVTSILAAVAGAYLAMLFTYLVYTAIAVIAFQISESSYRRLRTLGCGLAAAMMAWLLYRVSLQDVSNLAFLKAFGGEAIEFSRLPMVAIFMLPFFIFTKVIVAESLGSWLLWMVPSLLLNYLALQFLLYVEVALEWKALQRERSEFQANQSKLKAPNQGTSLGLDASIGVVPWFGGAGPIVWRQLKAILRLQRGLCWLLVPLASAFAVGAYLAYDAEQGAFQTVAVVVVMTSVFLPGLLPFDFRGDLNGLPALKMMPIRPLAVVLGQLCVPVALLTAFQCVALSTILLHDASQWSLVFWTVFFLIPTNIVIIALENLVFLIYPYKVAEFDMQATVRRVVMLMAKFCVVFLVVLVGLLAGFGVLGLKMAVQQTAIGGILAGVWQPLLIGLELVALFSVAIGVVWTTCLAYRRFDLSEDLPV